MRDIDTRIGPLQDKKFMHKVRMYGVIMEAVFVELFGSFFASFGVVYGDGVWHENKNSLKLGLVDSDLDDSVVVSRY